MNISDKILRAREERHHRIQKMNTMYSVVVSFKVNFPGEDKNHYMAFLLFNAFNESELNIQFEEKKVYQSDDGPYILYGIQGNDSEIKEKTVLFENNHVFGRFYDLDVYHYGLSISRHEKRRCYLCGHLAHECIREEKHSFESLYQYISKHVLEVYTNDLKMMIDQSMVEELLLEPKFGLVTQHSSGSHHDMNYDLMLKAKDAIMPYFIDMFMLSIMVDGSIEEYMDQFIDLGQSAEKAMYEVTDGVNCYKGLIFHLGLIVMAYGYTMSYEIYDDFHSTIKMIAKALIRQLKNEESFGQMAFQKYRIGGAKGEALTGYYHSIQALKKRPHLLDRLIYLMIRIEDTNLLKRAGSYEAYLAVKEELKGLDTTDIQSVQVLSEKYIDNSLSFGGSADMLVVSIFLDKLSKKHENICL
jgi:holo-ACP synthase CitX